MTAETSGLLIMEIIGFWGGIRCLGIRESYQAQLFSIIRNAFQKEMMLG